MPEYLITRTTKGWPKKKRGKRKIRGITNKQAHFLADLQRHAGLKYTGNGMTRQQAMIEIDRLVRIRDTARAEHKRLDAEWESSAKSGNRP